MPAPRAAGAGASFAVGGVLVSSDAAAVRTQLEKLIERGGMPELRDWFARYRGMDRSVKQAAAGVSGAGDIDAVDAAVSAANRQLEADATKFVDALGPAAVEIARGVLDQSEKTIQAELERYGIKEVPVEPPGGGGGSGAPAAYDTEIAVENVEAARDAQARARTLAAARRAADAAQRTFTDILASSPDPGLERRLETIPMFDSRYSAAEEAWKMSEDLFARQAVAATSEYPVIAIYAAGPGAADKLEGFAAQPIDRLGETVWREARTRLDNIETIRGQLGERFNPLLNPRIRQLALDREGVTAWQKRVGTDHARDKQDQAEADKMFWSMLAIGLGLIAAIPTGGGSVVVSGIGTAAAVAGAALTAYNAYESWREFQVASAASNTAFAKAQSISQDEPSFFWLALDIIGAGLEMTAAGVAFRNLVKIVKEARAARNVLKMASAVDAAAPPAAAGKIKATVAAELGPEAVNDLIRAEGAVFRSGDLTKIRRSLEQSALEGWTDAYDALAARGRIQPLTDDAIESALSHLPANDPAYSSLAEEYIVKHGVLTNQGIYSPESGIIFVKPGGQHTVANVVAHEIVHAGQARLGQNLNSFWAEFEAMAAQKRIILRLDAAGVGNLIEPRVAWLRDASDADLAKYINTNYGYPIPGNVGGFGKGDAQIARAAIAAAKRVLAVGAM